MARGFGDGTMDRFLREKRARERAAEEAAAAEAAKVPEVPAPVWTIFAAPVWSPAGSGDTDVIFTGFDDGNGAIYAQRPDDCTAADRAPLGVGLSANATGAAGSDLNFEKPIHDGPGSVCQDSPASRGSDRPHAEQHEANDVQEVGERVRDRG